MELSTEIDPLQAKALLQIAQEFSRGDEDIVAAMKAALENPPDDDDEVGFCLSGEETPFENCFRKLVGLLDNCEYGSSAEDKYTIEIFAQWLKPGRLGEFPAKFKVAFPEFCGGTANLDNGKESEQFAELMRNGFADAMAAVEDAFEKAGSPLLSLDTAGGDSLFFINVTPEVAKRWRNTEIGVTYEGIPLAIRSPLWGELWHGLAYSTDTELGEPPESVSRREPLRKLSDVSGLIS